MLRRQLQMAAELRNWLVPREAGFLGRHREQDATRRTEVQVLFLTGASRMSTSATMAWR